MAEPTPQQRQGKQEQKVCQLCDQERAVVRCTQCDMDLCQDDNKQLHKPSRMKHHTRTPIPHTPSSSFNATKHMPPQVPTATQQLHQHHQQQQKKKQYCDICEDQIATLYCQQCTVHLCTANNCDADMHKPAAMRTHTRVPLSVSPAATTTNSNDRKTNGSSHNMTPTAAAATSTTTKNVQGPVCNLCEEHPSTVFCAECDMFLCGLGNCDSDIHKPKKMQAHQRRAVTTADLQASDTPPEASRSSSGGGAVGGQAKDSPNQDQATAPMNANINSGASNAVRAETWAAIKGAPICSLCEEHPSVVFCSDCDMFLCSQNNCNAEIHRPKKMRQHKRRAVTVQDLNANGSIHDVEGGNNTQSRICSLCEKHAAEVFCSDCDMYLCTESNCDQDIHKPKKMQTHVRQAVAPGGTIVKPPKASADAVRSRQPVPPSVNSKRDNSVAHKGPPCSLCEEHPSTVFCAECDMFLCGLGNCDSDIHKPKKMQAHQRRAVTAADLQASDTPPEASRSSSGGGAVGGQAKDSPNQDQATAPMNANINSGASNAVRAETWAAIKGAPICNLCEEHPSVVFCSDCDMFLCSQNNCNAEIHRPKKMRHHKRRPVSATDITSRQDGASKAVGTFAASREGVPPPSKQSDASEGARVTAAAHQQEVCELCDSVSAVFNCGSCEMKLCKGCDEELHAPAKMRSHKRVRLDPPPPACEVCERDTSSSFCPSCEVYMCGLCQQEMHRPKKNENHTVIDVVQYMKGHIGKNAPEKPRGLTIDTAGVMDPPRLSSPTLVSHRGMKGVKLCDICDEGKAVISCKECGFVLCEANNCDSEIHAPKSLRNHVRVRMDEADRTLPAAVGYPVTSDVEKCTVCLIYDAEVRCRACKAVFCSTSELNCDSQVHTGLKMSHLRKSIDKAVTSYNTFGRLNVPGHRNGSSMQSNRRGSKYSSRRGSKRSSRRGSAEDMNAIMDVASSGHGIVCQLCEAKEADVACDICDAFFCTSGKCDSVAHVSKVKRSHIMRKITNRDVRRFNESTKGAADMLLPVSPRTAEAGPFGAIRFIARLKHRKKRMRSVLDPQVARTVAPIPVDMSPLLQERRLAPAVQDSVPRLQSDGSNLVAREDLPPRIPRLRESVLHVQGDAPEEIVGAHSNEGLLPRASQATVDAADEQAESQSRSVRALDVVPVFNRGELHARKEECLRQLNDLVKVRDRNGRRYARERAAWSEKRLSDRELEHAREAYEQKSDTLAVAEGKLQKELDGINTELKRADDVIRLMVPELSEQRKMIDALRDDIRRLSSARSVVPVAVSGEEVSADMHGLRIDVLKSWERLSRTAQNQVLDVTHTHLSPRPDDGPREADFSCECSDCSCSCSSDESAAEQQQLTREHKQSKVATALRGSFSPSFSQCKSVYVETAKKNELRSRQDGRRRLKPLRGALLNAQNRRKKSKAGAKTIFRYAGIQNADDGILRSRFASSSLMKPRPPSSRNKRHDKVTELLLMGPDGKLRDSGSFEIQQGCKDTLSHRRDESEEDEEINASVLIARLRVEARAEAQRRHRLFGNRACVPSVPVHTVHHHTLPKKLVYVTFPAKRTRGSILDGSEFEVIRDALKERGRRDRHVSGCAASACS